MELPFSEELRLALQKAFPAATIELLEGKNGHFMVLLDYNNHSFVIENIERGIIGLSEIRTPADNWLRGHEHFFDTPDVGSIVGKILALVGPDHAASS